MFASFGADVPLVVSLQRTFRTRIGGRRGARGGFPRPQRPPAQGRGGGHRAHHEGRHGRRPLRRRGVVRTSHAVLAIGSVPNSDGLALANAGVEVDDGGYIPTDYNCVTNVPHIYAAGDVSGKLPLSSVAAIWPQVAERLMGLHTGRHRTCPRLPRRPVLCLIGQEGFGSASAQEYLGTAHSPLPQAQRRGHELAHTWAAGRVSLGGRLGTHLLSCFFFTGARGPILWSLPLDSPRTSQRDGFRYGPLTPREAWSCVPGSHSSVVS